MIKVGIIGTGNIGKRHIQSIASIEEEKELFCYDSMQESLNSLDGFFEANNISFEKITKTKSFEEFTSIIDEDSIIIIATTASGRADLTVKVIEQKPKAVILEKPVCQTEKEYELILKSNKKNIPIYVNFPRHMYDFYVELKNKIGNKGRMYVNESRGGIACNGIHVIDLACWLFKSEKHKILTANMSKPFETKRKGFFDVSGELKIKLDENYSLEIVESEGNVVDTITILTEGVSYQIIEHLHKMVTVTTDKFEVTDINIPFQSQLTSKMVEDILKNNKTSLLPNISEAHISHKIVFEMFKMNDLNINFS